MISVARFKTWYPPTVLLFFGIESAMTALLCVASMAIPQFVQSPPEKLMVPDPPLVNVLVRVVPLIIYTSVLLAVQTALPVTEFEAHELTALGVTICCGVILLPSIFTTETFFVIKSKLPQKPFGTYAVTFDPVVITERELVGAQDPIGNVVVVVKEVVVVDERIVVVVTVDVVVLIVVVVVDVVEGLVVVVVLGLVLVVVLVVVVVVVTIRVVVVVGLVVVVTATVVVVVANVVVVVGRVVVVVVEVVAAVVEVVVEMVVVVVGQRPPPGLGLQIVVVVVVVCAPVSVVVDPSSATAVLVVPTKNTSNSKTLPNINIKEEFERVMQ
jgi:hypothetical protein